MTRSRPKRDRYRRARLTADRNPLRSIPEFATLSDGEFIGDLLSRYRTGAAIHLLGLRLTAREKRQIDAIFGRYPQSLLDDFISVIDRLQRLADSERLSARREAVAPAVEFSRLSREEWGRYLRRHFPPRIVRELEGIEQSATAADGARVSPMRRKEASTRRPQQLERRGRWLTHAILLAVATVIMGRSQTPAVLLAGVGVTGALLILALKDAASFAVAFTVKGRSKFGPFEVSLRVKASSWDSAAFYGILRAFASLALPREHLDDYVEDQLGNLLASETLRERINYLIDLVLNLPDMRKLYREAKRESAR